MVQKIWLLITVLILIVINSCKDNGAGPENIEPGRRDYVWTVDTIAYQGSYQTIMQTIWGSNPQNMWVAGHNERGSGKMYHYDGRLWAPVALPSLPSPTFHAMLGFTENNIYVVGSADYLINDNSLRLIDSSIIIHYDGSSWKTSLLNKGRVLFSITGTSNQILTAGLYKTIFEYDGINWRKNELGLNVPVEYDTHYASSILTRKDGSRIILYYCINNTKMKGLYYYLTFKDNGWTKIDSFIVTTNESKWGYKLWESPQGNLYSVNPGFYKLNGTSWKKVLNDNNLYTAVNGTSDNNIFLAGEKVMQYNGIDWYEFSDFSYKYGLAKAIYCFDKEVFIVFSNGVKSFVARGK